MQDFSSVKIFKTHPKVNVDDFVQNHLIKLIKNKMHAEPSNVAFSISDCLYSTVNNEVFYPFIYSDNIEKVKQYYNLFDSFYHYIDNGLFCKDQKVIANGRIDNVTAVVCGIAPGYLKGQKYENLLLSAKPVSFMARIAFYWTFPSDVYFTNISKYSIVNNQNDKAKDSLRKIINESLVNEINFVNPLKIYALGALTYELLKEHFDNVIKVYHPAYVLRQNNFEFNEGVIQEYIEHIKNRSKKYGA
jgi:uracil-DNA glycosylase